MRILIYLFHSPKRIFPAKQMNYARTMELNNMAANVQNVAYYIRKLNIVLEVYYTNNENSIYYKHM